MDKALFDLVAARTPKFNDPLVDGLAVSHMRSVEAYIDHMFRTAETDFPPEVRYEYFRRCTPYEEYAEETRRQSNQSTCELARSDIYLAMYQLSFNGEMLDPVFIYLPFVGDAGIITLRGSLFSISPVLADKAVSVDTDSIFIPLNRDKLTFERQIHMFYRGGERETAYVIWSEIYHISPKDKRIASKSAVRGKTTLVHYLLAKYGFTAMFAMYANIEVKVGLPEEINIHTYPESDWIICSSTQIKPRGVRDKTYVASNIRLVIRKADYNLTTAGLIAGFFYIVDLFPDRIKPEYVNEQRLWRVLMGHLLWGSGTNEGKLADDVAVHLRSLDGYLDGEAKANLREDNIYCETLYDLLYEIIDTFNHRVTQSNTQVASMYDKRLMVLRYALKDITKAINLFMFAITSSKKKPLTKQDVQKQMKRLFKPKLVLRINRDHGEVSSVAIPGDNKYFKGTSQITLQVDSSGGRGKKSSTNSPSQFLHASISEVGSHNGMGKSDHTGRNRVSPFVRIGPDNVIERDPDKVELIDSVQRKIQR